MAAEPDHLLWKCLCCEDWVENFRPRFPFSPSVSLSHTYTHIFTVNMVGTRMRRSPLLIFPFERCSRLPLCLFPSPPYWPPITLPRLYPQNKTAGQGRAFLQVQTYHVKRQHIVWRNWAKGRRGSFGRENINKGVLIWWSPVAHKEKWKKAKEKLLTIQTLWMTAWRPEAWDMNLVFRAWMHEEWILCLSNSFSARLKIQVNISLPFCCFYLLFFNTL